MSSRLQLGQAAPKFKLYDTKRNLCALQDWEGKTVVLAFFPGAFTEVCTKELCAFRDSLANFEAVNAQIVAVSVNDPFTNHAFAEHNRLHFPILCDFNRVVVKAYDVAHTNFANLEGYTAAKRSVFVISPKGFIRWTWVTNNPAIEPPYSDIQHAVDEIGRGRSED